MIKALLIAVQASSALPPPMVVDVTVVPSSVPAIAWKCQITSHDAPLQSVSGTFPSVSVSQQKNGSAFHLSTKMEALGSTDFIGSFPAALTLDDLMGMTQYSVIIPVPAKQEARYLLNFQFFRGSREGFVNVVRFDPKSGERVAFATGLCTTQAQS